MISKISTVFLLVELFAVVSSKCIRQEKGVFSEFDASWNTNFLCLNGATFSRSISFQSLFDNTPQIIIASLSYTYNKNAQFSFKIVTTTTSDWAFEFKCLSSAQVTKYKFTWIALDDDRFYVINDFMDSTQLVTGFISQWYSHSILANNNYYARAQIVSFVEGDSRVEILYDVGAIAIHIISGQAGLGAQIIVGSKNCFLELKSWAGAFFKSSLSFSLTQFSQALYPLCIVDQMFEVDGGTQCQDFRDIKYTFGENGDSQLGLNIDGWGYGLFSYYVLVYDTYPINLQPLYYKKLRVSKKLSTDSKLEFKNQWKLGIISMNQIFQDPQILTYDFYNQLLSLNYSYICQPNKKVTASILKCQNCPKQTYDVTQFCFARINMMTLYLDLYSSQIDYSQLNFKLTNQGFILEQVINKTSSCDQRITYQLLSLQIQNQ